MRHKFHLTRQQLNRLEQGGNILAMPAMNGPHLARCKHYEGHIDIPDDLARKLLAGQRRVSKGGTMKRIRISPDMIGDGFASTLRNVDKYMGSGYDDPMAEAIERDRQAEEDKKSADQIRKGAMEDADRRKSTTKAVSQIADSLASATLDDILPKRPIHAVKKEKLLKRRVIKKKGEGIGLIEEEPSTKVEQINESEPNTVGPTHMGLGERGRRMTKVHRLAGPRVDAGAK